MKKYIVKGTDLPSLLSKVAKHFNVDINKIKYEVLRKTPELEVKVWTEHETEAPEDNNFSIELRDDGIFLTVKEIDDVKSSTLKKILKYKIFIISGVVILHICILKEFNFIWQRY